MPSDIPMSEKGLRAPLNTLPLRHERDRVAELRYEVVC